MLSNILRLLLRRLLVLEGLPEAVRLLERLRGVDVVVVERIIIRRPNMRDEADLVLLAAVFPMSSETFS